MPSEQDAGLDYNLAAQQTPFEMQASNRMRKQATIKERAEKLLEPQQMMAMRKQGTFQEREGDDDYDYDYSDNASRKIDQSKKSVKVKEIDFERSAKGKQVNPDEMQSQYLGS